MYLPIFSLVNTINTIKTISEVLGQKACFWQTRSYEEEAEAREDSIPVLAPLCTEQRSTELAGDIQELPKHQGAVALLCKHMSCRTLHRTGRC